jgi:hypothetical protein
MLLGPGVAGYGGVPYAAHRPCAYVGVDCCSRHRPNLNEACSSYASSSYRNVTGDPLLSRQHQALLVDSSSACR